MTIPGNFLSLVTETVDPNTSGWTAMLNATVTLGTGGRSGDGCLSIKSVAAGEMRARTVSSYVVSEGTLYEAFADASGATVPERIGIRWLSAAGAELSITWSLPTAAASASWHRVVVAGAAPVGTARAQVVISSTPAAAGVITYAENAYLGLPVRTLGNLLGFNTESPEVDVSGWAVDANCALTRTVPAVTWPVDYYLAGGHVLTATVTATGGASIKTAAAATASAGVEYVGWCYLNPPSAAAATWVELRFVDDSGTVLDTQRSQLAAPGTGWYRQIVSRTAPADTTGVVVAVGITGATAGQVLRADAVMVADRETAVATGLIGQTPNSIVPFADADMEQGTGSWTVTSGVATIARSTPWGALAAAESYSLTVTSSTATASAVTSGRWPLPAGAPGQDWQLAYYLHVAAGGWILSDAVTWYDASGSVISTSTSTTATVPGAGWWLDRSPYVPPAGAVAGSVSVMLTAPAAGAVAALDAIALTQAYPITSEVVDADRAAVVLTRRDLTVGEYLTLWRVDAAGHRTLVRGPAGLLDGYPITASAMVVTDYEAPLGELVSYYSEVRDSTGTVVSVTEWDAVTVPAPDIHSVWIKDPGNPQRNMLLIVPAGGGPDWQYPMDTAAYVVKGRRRKVTLHGVRNGGEGDLSVVTRSDDERAALDLLLSSGNDLLVQAAPSVGLDCSYVSVGQPTKARGGQDSTDAWRTWTLPLTEADMPTAVGVAGSAGRTWQDVLTEFATWADVRDAFATWEDVFLNRRKQ